MRVLVTGGAGFIGSHTVEQLVKNGHEVRVLDDLSTGREANLAAADGARLITGDIRDYEAVAAAAAGCDVILHLAAVSSVQKSLDDPLGTEAINIGGTVHVFEAARRQAVRRLIFASSAAVYGDAPELPKTEQSATEPLSPYAWHKLTGEFYGRTWARLYGLQFLSLRYFNVYGPRQDPTSPYSGVLSIFLSRAAEGRPLVIHGDGGQTRDFIHVSDVSQINLLATEVAWPLAREATVINVATGKETSINEAAAIVRAAGGSRSPVVHDEARESDIRRSCADPALLLEALGYRPAVEVGEGLSALLADSVR